MKVFLVILYIRNKLRLSILHVAFVAFVAFLKIGGSKSAKFFDEMGDFCNFRCPFMC